MSDLDNLLRRAAPGRFCVWSVNEFGDAVQMPQDFYASEEAIAAAEACCKQMKNTQDVYVYDEAGKCLHVNKCS